MAREAVYDVVYVTARSQPLWMEYLGSQYGGGSVVALAGGKCRSEFSYAKRGGLETLVNARTTQT